MTPVSTAAAVKRFCQAISGIARMTATRSAHTTVCASLIARSIDAGATGIGIGQRPGSTGSPRAVQSLHEPM